MLRSRDQFVGHDVPIHVEGAQFEGDSFAFLSRYLYVGSDWGVIAWLDIQGQRSFVASQFSIEGLELNGIAAIVVWVGEINPFSIILDHKSISRLLGDFELEIVSIRITVLKAKHNRFVFHGDDLARFGPWGVIDG